MTYVVTDSCVKCKYTDCVEVCPVECFYEGELMLAINPDECIDCGVCVSECPVNAISPESDDLLIWIERARENSASWPKITQSKSPLKDADRYQDEENKYEKYVSVKS